MIERTLKEELLRVSEHFPVSILTGPRQSGKTTLCKMAFPNYKYVNLENPDTREMIINDPMSFLRNNPNGMILDEAQRYPELFSYLQVIVDEDKSLRFVLSGSNNFILMEKITQSLAGRAALMTLLPLSVAELRPTQSTDEMMFRGFYPAVPLRSRSHFHSEARERDKHSFLFRYQARRQQGRRPRISAV